jgi:hypothetical protein|tara:strand:- start:1794 stop:2222 length:429 start_codon:yes stop_codon:yes gene_type:complete
MKTKAEQLEKLKATAVKLQQQIEALEKTKQWEPRGGSYWVRIPTIDNACKFGVERQTAEAAEKASTAMRTHNRLLAYVDEFGGDWEADWSDNQYNYYVYYNHLRMAWSATMSITVCASGTVYMPKDCALGLVAKLNSGEVVL